MLLYYNMLKQHALHCVFLFSLIIFFMRIVKKDEESSRNIIETHGWLTTILLYFVRSSPLFPFVQSVFNFCGLVFYNAFPKKVELNKTLAHAPFLCVRVVTRGLYPSLVSRNVLRNLAMCSNVGLKNFTIDVVTDKPIHLPQNKYIREIVVPPDYQTKNGSLYKARALHYCWEDDVNTLSDSDWIVHLDEETLLTEDSIKGTLNFMFEDKHDFGQGVITYANDKIVNWVTTLADTQRVAIDMGMFRFQLLAFHKPLLGWKGSFMVAKALAEKKVSFDNGPEGSITEDGYFALKAFSQGYSFNFIEGEMWEMSSFTMLDFIRQRRRWTQGFILTSNSGKIPLKFRVFYMIYVYTRLSLPIAFCNSFLAIYYSVPYPYILELIISALGAIKVYLHIYGSIRSFSMKRYGYFKIVLVLATVMILPIFSALEMIATLWAVFSDKQQFYVIDKNITKSMYKEVTTAKIPT